MTPLNKLGVFLSASLSDRDSELNMLAHDELKIRLSHNNFKPKQVLGRYNGVMEYSYYVEIQSFRELNTLQELAKEFKQESILLVLPNNKAKLIYSSDGRDEDIGTLTRSSMAECRNLNAYSIMDGVYYTTK